MENMGEWEQKSLINELTQGRELARQLQVYLNLPSSSSSSNETRDLLAQKIQASYEKAFSMLNYNIAPPVAAPHPSGLAIRMLESPPSGGGSPRSEDLDRGFKEPELKDASKKRKTLPRWTQQVRVTPGTDLEGHLDDGFSWRKYGQKDILGAKYPRGYYRCTHRNVQGCLATKQVQRSDNDPTIFEITYLGIHTCCQASRMMPSLSGPSDESNQEQGTVMEPKHHDNQQPEQNQTQSHDLLLSFQRGLKVITQDFDDIHDQTYIPSSTTSNVVVFSSPLGNPSPSFMSSPATSTGTNYFSMSPSPTEINNMDYFRTSEPQLAEVIQAGSAATTSATSSTTVGLDFPFGNPQFDPNFTFDNHGFFP